jgi:hypothetical protein
VKVEEDMVDVIIILMNGCRRWVCGLHILVDPLLVLQDVVFLHIQWVTLKVLLEVCCHLQ